MGMRIVIVDVLDDKDPPILVQRFFFDDRALLVFRKPTGLDEEQTDWELAQRMTVDERVYWAMDRTFLDTAEDLAGTDVLEQFALLYRDEDVQPSYDPNYRNDASPYASIVYSPAEGLYRCEPCFVGYDSLEEIATESFKAALYFAAEALHDLLAQHGE